MVDAAGAARQVVDVREFGTTVARLSDRDGLALSLVAPGVLDVRPTGTAGEFRLRTEGVVGTLVAGGVTVRIRPKVRLDTLLYLLSGSLDDVSWFRDQHSREATDDLSTALYAMYARLLGRALRAGLVRSYRPRHERVNRARGRIDFSELASTPHRPPVPAPCHFDEFTADTDLNRFLKAATRDASRDGSLPASIRLLLRGHLAAMVEVSDQVPRPDEIDGHVFTRLDRHYETPARLARLILGRRSVAERAGTVQGDTFLVDMSTVFEDHVADGLRHRMPQGIDVEREPGTHFDHDRHLTMKPDIVFTRDRRPVHVADVKYKLLKGARGRSSDLYQAYAYSSVMGLPVASLLYAEREGGPPPKRIRVVNSDTVIETHELSLRGRPQQIEQALDDLAQRLLANVLEPNPSARRADTRRRPVGAVH